MAEDPRTRILDAAEQAFADLGLAGARTAAIAEGAGVNKAMLHYYFGSKEDLYVAVLERVVEQVSNLAGSALGDVEADPMERLSMFMDGYASILRAHPNFAPIMVRELVSGVPHVAPIFKDKMWPILPQAAEVLGEAQKAGVLNPAASFPMAGPVMISPFVFFAFARPLMEQIFGPFTPELAETYHRTAKEVVLNGLRARKEAS
jgi:TetR/AcrR family transcriptional regulator